MTKPPFKIEAVLEGPAARGRVPVDVLVTLARELQSSLRRISSHRRRRGGRFLASVEEACRLDFVSFREGSAVCTFELAPPRGDASLFGDIGVRAAEELLRSLEAGEAGVDGWSRSLQPGLLESLDKLTRVVGGGIDGVSFRLQAGSVDRRVHIGPAFRSNLRAALAPKIRPDEVEVEGVIWECDWQRHTAELHRPDGERVELRFPTTLEEEVTSARRQRVVAHGRLNSAGKMPVLEVSRIDSVVDGLRVGDPAYGAFSDNLGVEELAARQGVPVPASLDVLRGDWLDGESVDDLLQVVGRIRR